MTHLMARRPADAARAASVVWSCDEWSPLEEVVVGIVDSATLPAWHVALEATMPRKHWPLYQASGGQPFPAELIDLARLELDALERLLEAEGIVVRRPEPVDFSRPFATPHWSSPGGLYAAMPRDLLLVVGDELIESPMAWRSRYFEANAYRPLLKAYFRAGARWTAAPRPELTDALYDPEWRDPGDDGPTRLLLTEVEPTFDAADFIRCGRDLFAQRSNVTNAFGIEWLRRHLGPDFRVHELALRDSHPMHIDASLMPLAPGRLLINPERVPEIPAQFKSWEILVAPPPSIPESHPLYMTSRWINMNVLSLDERRVVVEAQDEPMIVALKRWGFEPVPCPFRNFNSFGGSFHCATADIRRRGALESYW